MEEEKQKGKIKKENELMIYRKEGKRLGIEMFTRFDRNADNLLDTYEMNRMQASFSGKEFESKISYHMLILNKVDRFTCIIKIRHQSIETQKNGILSKSFYLVGFFENYLFIYLFQEHGLKYMVPYYLL